MQFTVTVEPCSNRNCYVSAAEETTAETLGITPLEMHSIIEAHFAGLYESVTNRRKPSVDTPHPV
jgi:hypothetical protein